MRKIAERELIKNRSRDDDEGEDRADNWFLLDLSVLPEKVSSIGFCTRIITSSVHMLMTMGWRFPSSCAIDMGT